MWYVQSYKFLIYTTTDYTHTHTHTHPFDSVDVVIISEGWAFDVVNLSLPLLFMFLLSPSAAVAVVVDVVAAVVVAAADGSFLFTFEPAPRFSLWVAGWCWPFVGWAFNWSWSGGSGILLWLSIVAWTSNLFSGTSSSLWCCSGECIVSDDIINENMQLQRNGER